jgi:hypothetical protein
MSTLLWVHAEAVDGTTKIVTANHGGPTHAQTRIVPGIAVPGNIKPHVERESARNRTGYTEQGPADTYVGRFCKFDELIENERAGALQKFPDFRICSPGLGSAGSLAL